jgi:glutathione S-transferase
MRLYHHPLSTNARRAVLTAVHLEAPVELVLVDLPKGAHLGPQFLKMNPNHRVPVLEDDAFILWESCAIAQYLADRTAAQTIYPVDTRARADINRWLFWCAQHFSYGIGILNWEHFIKRLIGQGAADPAEVRRGEQAVREFGGVLDAHLCDRDWICGHALTLADLAIAAPLADTERAKLPVRDFANVQRWFARVQSLDAWKRTEPPVLPAQ